MISSSISGQGRGLPHLPVLPDISSSNSSPEAFDFLHQHLAECTTEHTLCSAENNRNMPKRLIHIKNGHHATLVEVIDGSRHVNAIYAALSYCWGGDQSFKAERSNLPLMMENGFLIADLPIVLRETIGLCRKLGLLYLWIDALCIVQDDEVDWAEESARMGTIYQNAHLTIAAASSGSVDTAYLDNRLNQKRQPVEFVVPPATPGRPSTIVSARRYPIPWHWREVKRPDEDPWRLRGWTLQEEILSRRLVVFGAEEMQWRCRTTTACECVTGNFVYNNWPKQFSEDDGQILRETKEDDFLAMVNYWRYGVVSRYSPRLVTYPQDRFPAVSGIARRVARVTGWTYVAGMWLETLLFDMCWENSFIEGLEPFRPDYTAPTFSWGSVNGSAVIHRWLHYETFTPDAAVVDISIEMRHAGDPFGALVDGYIVVRGRLAPASLEYGDGRYYILLDNITQDHDYTPDRPELEFCPDTHIQAVPVAAPSPEGHQDNGLWTGTRASKGPNGVDAARLGAPPESGGCAVWILLLGTCLRSRSKREVQCVLVLGKSIRRPGAYERLGLVSTHGDAEPQLTPMKNRGWTETLTIV